jgi:hypothetical protein
MIHTHTLVFVIPTVIEVKPTASFFSDSTPGKDRMRGVLAKVHASGHFDTQTLMYIALPLAI